MDIENRPAVDKGGDGRGKEWEVRVSRGKLLCMNK